MGTHGLPWASALRAPHVGALVREGDDQSALAQVFHRAAGGGDGDAVFLRHGTLPQEHRPGRQLAVADQLLDLAGDALPLVTDFCHAQHYITPLSSADIPVAVHRYAPLPAAAYRDP